MNWKEAHLRMLETLPKRTHKAAEEVGDTNWRHWRKNNRGGSKQNRPVIINGVRYHSLTAAANALGSNRPAIWQMINRGEAAFE